MNDCIQMQTLCIPRLHNDLYKSIIESFDISNNYNENNFSVYYLSDIRLQLRKVSKDWEMYENKTNTYEYLYTNIPGMNYGVCYNKPNTPFYFILIEIIRMFFLESNDLLSKYSMKTFQFEKNDDLIPALQKIRNNENDMHTIFSNELNEKINLESKNVQYENISYISIENFKFIREKYKSSINFITCINISNTDSIKTIYGCVCYALCIQKHQGSFILKIPDILNQFSIDIIALLSSLYNEVFLTKPLSSRDNCCDKYIICKSFIPTNSDSIYSYLLSSFQNLINAPSSNYYSLFKSHNMFFTNKIIEFNTIICQNQIENIHSTLNLIYNDKNSKLLTKSKIDNILDINLQKCIKWCNIHHEKTNSIK
jgi:hypothetical protein